MSAVDDFPALAVLAMQRVMSPGASEQAARALTLIDRLRQLAGVDQPHEPTGHVYDQATEENY